MPVRGGAGIENGRESGWTWVSVSDRGRKSRIGRLAVCGDTLTNGAYEEDARGTVMLGGICRVVRFLVAGRSGILNLSNYLAMGCDISCGRHHGEAYDTYASSLEG